MYVSLGFFLYVLLQDQSLYLSFCSILSCNVIFVSTCIFGCVTSFSQRKTTHAFPLLNAPFRNAPDQLTLSGPVYVPSPCILLFNQPP